MTLSQVKTQPAGKPQSSPLERAAQHIRAEFQNARPAARPADILARLDAYEKLLEGDHAYFQKTAADALNVSYASEWVLDNYYILRQSLRQIREDLSPGFLRRLPKIDRFGQPGFPRAYFIARDLLELQSFVWNGQTLREFVDLIQDAAPLSMGELWSLPIFLRFVLMEGILVALREIVKPEQELPYAVAPFKLDAGNDDIVANAVVSLRALSNTDWKAFFETVNRVDQILGQDPAGVYSIMDFATRDHYRKEVERMAYAARRDENQVAAAALEMARQAPAGWREAHIGYWLVDDGRPVLERSLGIRPRGMMAHARVALYVSGSLLFTALLLGLASLLLVRLGASTSLLLSSLALLLVPALTVATSVINWWVTLVLPPSLLPKVDLSEGIPADLRTLVIVPCLLTHRDGVQSLVRQLEQHYLRNPSAGLSFALLSDFADADAKTQPDDEYLLRMASQQVEQLNARHRAGQSGPFLLLHRTRAWNPSEGTWMGWERKRGKLHDLNRMLLGEDHPHFTTIVGDLSLLNNVRYVITLDADTILPLGAANRLIGTLAHPLNRAVFSAQGSRIVAGYSILQPRVEISPRSASRSWFSRIFSGDIGLDLYSRAVSDVYQDLSGEGIYVGKGIYDVRAFERSTEGQIGENQLLSHDLLEGLLGRAGLVTDITLIEDYPGNYFEFARRAERWMRGDWQLLPWLLRPRRAGGRLGLLDIWKMFDNLRRSLLAPSLVALLLAGWSVLPGPAGLWSALAALTLAVPLLTHGLYSLLKGVFQRESVRAILRPLLLDLLRWLLVLAFLPFEALDALMAIVRTLYRLAISRRNLLQWTTAAQTARELRLAVPLQALRDMLPSLLLALAVGAGLAWAFPRRLPAALPLLALWLAAPVIATALNRPVRRAIERLTPAEERRLRSYARRTWAFYEAFVGPEDHWLPPDHYQEYPLGLVAHRTSPTNTGMLLASTMAAYDLGYIDQYSLVSRLSATMDTLARLERYRGHFINWIDTRTLEALSPRYISTVDSGNLAACLVLVAQSLQAMSRAHIFRWNRWQGYLDLLDQVVESALALNGGAGSQSAQALSQFVTQIRAQVLAVREETPQWYALFQQVRGPYWEQIAAHLSEFVATLEDSPESGSLQPILQASRQLDQHVKSIERTIQELVPWIPLLEAPPNLLSSADFAPDLAQLRVALPYSPAISEIRAHTAQAQGVVSAVKEHIRATGRRDDEATAALYWLDTLSNGMEQAREQSSIMLASYHRLAREAEQLVEDMDFRFLYNRERHVFHIGYNLDAARLDDNYYDLLASEARITSLIAIAAGEVPVEHWLHLNRPVTSLHGMRVLLSWSATLFEYLMPTLFLRTYPGTLLEESANGAVLWQMRYGQQHNVPWGISESGFYHFDANQNYQYRAFGVPGLGFKRGLADDLVVAPYASLMAIGFQPRQVMQNAARLAALGGLGQYGFYEALDFTEKRLPAGENHATVRSYMAHHQGMALLAMVNYLHNNVLVDRMHADPQIRSVELLLQEQVPLTAPLQDPESENVGGTQRLIPPLVSVTPWSVPTQTSIPQVHLLTNESFTSLLSNSGSGYLRWKDTDLTRWQPDGVLDDQGIWLYLQDLDGKTPGQPWSLSKQPLPVAGEEPSVVYHAHMAEYRRASSGLSATLQVTVPPEDAVEIRRVHVHNPGERPRHLRLTSYGEVILTTQAADARHPAFNKLFIQSEWVENMRLLVFRRRPRSNKETPPYLGHMLVAPEGASPARFETDRMAFFGRGGSPSRPRSLLDGSPAAGSTGSTLDPVFSLGLDITIQPHSGQSAAWVTFAAGSREELLSLAARYRAENAVQHAFDLAQSSAENRLRRAELGGDTLEQFSRLLSSLVYPLPQSRAGADVISANRMGQSGLWPFGISGDYPILLVEIRDTQKLELVREAVLAHHFFRERGMLIDLVILNAQHTDYGAEMNRLLYRLITRSGSDAWINQRGGIFVVYADQMKPAERTLLRTAARVVLLDERGSLAEQLAPYSTPVQHLPAFTPSRVPGDESESTPPLPALEPLSFFNGLGGFGAGGREYVIDLPPGRQTPLPWSNVVGYPDFGFLVTESGASTTWAGNSGENRLTPWSNDPVTDPSGEALYLRDEETGAVWTPTPQPAGQGGHSRVRHGAGYTQFEQHTNGLRHRLRLYAAPDAPVKFIHLRLENTWDRPRRITATQYVEWVLGTLRATTQPFLIPEYLDEQAALLVSNPYSAEFAERVAFLAASKRVHGMTADRAEFLGRNGSMAAPAALGRIGLEGRVTPGDHPCAVLQLHIDLPPGGSEEIFFVLGQGSSRQHALELIQAYRAEEAASAAWDATHAFWDDLLGGLQVRTPDAALDPLLNRWLLYQALSCRIWGRTAFYQSSGAFGFRDQLQDVLALLPTTPAIAREQILLAAQHQFTQGDVLHWWHPPSGRGVRTRFSDDLLWLPYVTSEYVRVTGDQSILVEKVPFLTGPELAAGEEEHYGQFETTPESHSLYEHCRRALARGDTRGAHGLPLMGGGDWNDGMNRVGIEGRGESVWLGWFLLDTLQRFAAVSETHGSPLDAHAYRARAAELRAALEASAWDGAWYLRAFYDSGQPLGSRNSLECQIDAIAQSWAVISGGGDPQRQRQAMASVQERLVREKDRLILLFTPPFDKTPLDPGYIKGYVPGIRENGGQYTHAAIWTVWAYAMLGDGARAGNLLRLLNPALHAGDDSGLQRYKVEPYVIAADVYGVDPHTGRGGWTWYTGSAAWLYRLGTEALLGLRREGQALHIQPAIPPEWDEYTLEYRCGSSLYTIHVRKGGSPSVRVDGVEQPAGNIPLADDGRPHQVEMILGTH